MAFCSAVGFIAVRVLGLVKSHNMSAREYATRVMPIGEQDGYEQECTSASSSTVAAQQLHELWTAHADLFLPQDSMLHAAAETLWYHQHNQL